MMPSTSNGTNPRRDAGYADNAAPLPTGAEECGVATWDQVGPALPLTGGADADMAAGYGRNIGNKQPDHASPTLFGGSQTDRNLPPARHVSMAAARQAARQAAWQHSVQDSTDAQPRDTDVLFGAAAAQHAEGGSLAAPGEPGYVRRIAMLMRLQREEDKLRDAMQDLKSQWIAIAAQEPEIAAQAWQDARARSAQFTPDEAAFALQEPRAAAALRPLSAAEAQAPGAPKADEGVAGEVGLLGGFHPSLTKPIWEWFQPNKGAMSAFAPVPWPEDMPDQKSETEPNWVPPSYEPARPSSPADDINLPDKPVRPDVSGLRVAMSDAAMITAMLEQMDFNRGEVAQQMADQRFQNEMTRYCDSLKAAVQSMVDLGGTEAKTLPPAVVELMWKENAMIDGVPVQNRYATMEEFARVKYKPAELTPVIAGLDNIRSSHTEMSQRFMSTLQVALGYVQISQQLNTSYMEGLKQIKMSIAKAI